MSRRCWIVFFSLLLVSTGGEAPGATSKENELVRLAEHIFNDRCPRRLLGETRFPFREAEIACAAFIAGTIEAHALSEADSSFCSTDPKLARRFAKSSPSWLLPSASDALPLTARCRGFGPRRRCEDGRRARSRGADSSAALGSCQW